MRRFEPQPDRVAGECDDPGHDHYCDCGADPDAGYEREAGK